MDFDEIDLEIKAQFKLGESPLAFIRENCQQILQEKSELQDLAFQTRNSPNQEGISLLTTLFLTNKIFEKRREILQELSLKSEQSFQQKKTSKKEKAKINRIRRLKKEIDRSFECFQENCRKSYGSQNALNQHLKIKHNVLIPSVSQF